MWSVSNLNRDYFFTSTKKRWQYSLIVCSVKLEFCLHQCRVPCVRVRYILIHCYKWDNWGFLSKTPLFFRLGRLFPGFDSRQVLPHASSLFCSRRLSLSLNLFLKAFGILYSLFKGLPIVDFHSLCIHLCEVLYYLLVRVYCCFPGLNQLHDPNS